ARRARRLGQPPRRVERLAPREDAKDRLLRAVAGARAGHQADCSKGVLCGRAMSAHEPKVTPGLVAQHGLSPEEYERIVEALGREPRFVELGIFSAMWSEHCSYKSSRRFLRNFPTKGPRVLQGPGENA